MRGGLGSSQAWPWARGGGTETTAQWFRVPLPSWVPLWAPKRPCLLSELGAVSASSLNNQRIS